MANTTISRRAIDLDPTTFLVLTVWSGWQRTEQMAVGHRSGQLGAHRARRQPNLLAMQAEAAGVFEELIASSTFYRRRPVEGRSNTVEALVSNTLTRAFGSAGLSTTVHF
ncbi:MAG: hypothetical protein ACRDWA_04940 [Acidimicrobiia bacterium]